MNQQPLTQSVLGVHPSMAPGAVGTSGAPAKRGDYNQQARAPMQQQAGALPMPPSQPLNPHVQQRNNALYPPTTTSSPPVTAAVISEVVHTVYEGLIFILVRLLERVEHFIDALVFRSTTRYHYGCLFATS